MNIVHIGFGGPYTETMCYQDNLLPRSQKELGHDVTYIANCFQWNGSELEDVPSCDKIMADGVRLIRLPLKKILGSAFLANKIRRVPKLYSCLCDIAPDMIMLHDPQALCSLDVCKYVRNHPKTELVLDSHADRHNSGTNFVSLNILHRLFYRPIVKKVATFARRFYYLSAECKEFTKDVYGIPESKLDYLPLGGVLFSEDIFSQYRTTRRNELGLHSDDILIVHSGKMSAAKRTIELLNAVHNLPNTNLRLVIIGIADPEVKKVILSISEQDPRILFLGWKNGQELLEYLCGADIYAQPGTQSATMQNAVCCNCAILVYPYESHKLLLKNSALYVESSVDIENALRQLCDNPQEIEHLKLMSNKLAHDSLDYKAQAEKIEHDCSD